MLRNVPIGEEYHIEDKKGNIWTSSGNSLLCYDEHYLYDINPTVKEIKVSEGNTFLLWILEADDGSIWAGAMGHQGKVYRYDGKTITDFRSKWRSEMKCRPTN